MKINLKFSNKIAASLVCICMFLQILGVGFSASAVESENTDDSPRAVLENGVVTVTGVAKSHLKRTNISFLVLKPGKSIEGVTPLSASDDVCICDQVQAGIGGAYSFKFNVDSGFGEYKIYINEEVSNGEAYRAAEVLSVYNYAEPTAEIKSDKMGHIYYNGDKTDFELNVSATPNMESDIEVTTKVVRLDMNENGENIDGEEVAAEVQSKHTGSDGKASFNIDFSDELDAKYGVFKITSQISDRTSGKTTAVSSRFSRVNADHSRENMNYRMGIQQHLQNGWDNNNGFYGAGQPIVEKVPGGADADGFYNLFADAGYYLQREELHWSIFDKGKVVKNENNEWENKYNGYTFRSDQKQYFDQMKEKGLKPLIILGLENKNYFTVDESGNYIRPYENELYFEAYERYCYEAVKATLEYTDKYEIMNEYNIGFNRFLEKDSNGEWAYKEIDFMEYVRLMKAAYEGAHRAASEAGKNITVYGISSAQISNWYDNFGIYTFEDGTKSKFAGNKTYEWINGILKNGGGQYMDELSFHVYTNTYKPENARGDKAAVADDIKKLLEQNNCGDIPLFISETGYSTNFESESVLANTEVQQAKYELRDWARVYNKVSGISWYNAIEKPNANGYEHSLGHIKMHSSYKFTDAETGEEKEWAVDIPYEAKRVYLAFANWNTLLANSELKRENVSGNKYDYEFETPDGRWVHMIWNSDDVSDSIQISANSESAVIYDMYGNAEDIVAEDGRYTINISGEPVYLEESRVKVKFVDANGKEINKIGDNLTSLTVNVSIDKVQTGLESAMVIVAAYDSNGKIINAITKSASPSVSADVSTSSVSEIRVFIWADANSIRPIAKYGMIKR